MDKQIIKNPAAINTFYLYLISCNAKQVTFPVLDKPQPRTGCFWNNVVPLSSGIVAGCHACTFKCILIILPLLLSLLLLLQLLVHVSLQMISNHQLVHQHTHYCTQEGGRDGHQRPVAVGAVRKWKKKVLIINLKMWSLFCIHTNQIGWMV